MNIMYNLKSSYVDANDVRNSNFKLTLRTFLNIFSIYFYRTLNCIVLKLKIQKKVIRFYIIFKGVKSLNFPSESQPSIILLPL